MVFTPKAQILASDTGLEQNLSQYLPEDDEVVFILKYIPQKMIRLFEGIFPNEPSSWQQPLNWLQNESKEWQKGSDAGQEPAAAENHKKPEKTSDQKQKAKEPGTAKRIANLIYGEVEDIIKNVYRIFKK